ncbi:tetratricopeptide repeat protein [Nocardia vaccinii]|uniref:tetratricopeptide repeat protein n=1 Tax=Nocardia vaccinii TaxID=1822 RepID=UPI000837A8CC|nr:tetratricopeptide repeat protein [Nocardia vaccinii]
MTSAADAADLGPDEFAVESPVQIVEKSSLWQGFLRTASVLSTSLLLELISKLLENRVGQSPTLASASSWLSRIAILVVLVAAAYLILRRLATMRERLRVRQEMRLTADLISPGPEVRSWPSSADFTAKSTVLERFPSQIESRARWRKSVVLRVLDALPFEQYEAVALYEMASAILTAGRRLPVDEELHPASATVEIDRLRRAGVLVRITDDRVAVRRTIVRWMRAATQLGRVHDRGVRIEEQPEWDAALPALIHHHADRATRWSAALDTRRLGAGAQRWFAQESDQLLDLIARCAEMKVNPHKRAVVDAAVPELLRIADALDRWYARNGWSAAKDGLAQEISKLLTGEEQPVEYELIQIRLTESDGAADGGEKPDADRKSDADDEPRLKIDSSVTWLHRYKAPLMARRDEREAWMFLAREWSPKSLKQAGERLERAWRRLPARDAAGSVCLLVDLAIVRLHEGRLEAARNCLAVAQTLAGDDRDPAGVAHVYETLGVLRWMRGEPRRALHDWQRALRRFRDLNHDLGIARCLQHLGSAMAEFPEYGGLLVSGEPSRGEVLRQAGGWLAEALSMRAAIAPTPGTGRRPAQLPAEAALARVRARLTGESGLFDPELGPRGDVLLEGVECWPLAVPEDAGSPSRES